MRTKDPTSIRKDFVGALTDVRNTFNNAQGTSLAANQKKLVAEFCFLSAATLWEGFLGDIFVAYINRKSKKFRDSLGNL